MGYNYFTVENSLDFYDGTRPITPELKYEKQKYGMSYYQRISMVSLCIMSVVLGIQDYTIPF